MRTVEDLQAFDLLARRAIDPVLEIIASENQDRNPDYIVEVELSSSPFRDRCRLTIRNRDPTKSLLTASLIFTEAAPNETIRVEWCEGTINDGKPSAVTTLKWADATEAEIERLARGRVDDFFRRVT